MFITEPVIAIVVLVEMEVGVVVELVIAIVVLVEMGVGVVVVVRVVACVLFLVIEVDFVCFFVIWLYLSD